MAKPNKSGLASVEELRAMSEDELRAKLAAQRLDLMNARFRHATAQLERTSDLKAMRRQVARISTILKEKSAAKAGA